MAKIMHIQGLVRRAEIQKRRDTGEAWGARMSVLTEPDGDTVDVTAFDRVVTPADVLELKNHKVDLTVEVAVRPGTAGGAFLNVTLVSIDSVESLYQESEAA